MELNLHIETPISREEYVNAEVEIMKEHDLKLIDNILENYVYNKIDNLSELEFQKLCINSGYYDATDDELLEEFLASFKKCEDPEYKWVVTADCGVFFYFKTKEQAEDKARKMKEENYQWIEVNSIKKGE
tara:strand:+ start:269 stop:658 length:390 start_codon:yes stop_codon:yes gene_type:complete